MTDLGTDFARIVREEARLIILKALAEQTNESLSSSMLEQVLSRFAIHQERPWIHQQMEYLRTMEAITVVDAGTVKIATLTDHGHRHLSRHIAIEGVKRPSRPGA
ncbi:hypothetical protein RHAB21_00708 [Pseudorhizobium halotolerans]|uniref:Uncharacterized protein n=1 Tax=Pseudorhizobium halotolerans TaxID=1233081 RepID=A0ABM8PYU8_9HYPH|nr:hypothetical protein [Pseudorhizobium halotolerans]CAD7055391.1 hypothetical protein RHAB21_00708 [Pseudorhizobium halotolerans]